MGFYRPYEPKVATLIISIPKILWQSFIKSRKDPIHRYTGAFIAEVQVREVGLQAKRLAYNIDA
jgi:hypothetical protein